MLNAELAHCVLILILYGVCRSAVVYYILWYRVPKCAIWSSLHCADSHGTVMEYKIGEAPIRCAHDLHTLLV